MRQALAIAALSAFAGALIGYTVCAAHEPWPDHGRIACSAYGTVTVANIELDWRVAPDGEEITVERLDRALRGLCGKRA